MKFSLEAARNLLDRVKRGENVQAWRIRRALIRTGDLSEADTDAVLVVRKAAGEWRKTGWADLGPAEPFDQLLKAAK